MLDVWTTASATWTGISSLRDGQIIVAGHVSREFVRRHSRDRDAVVG